MRTLRSLLAAVLLTLAACAGARPPARASFMAVVTKVASSLRGHVLDEAGRPLAAAHVVIVGPDGKTLERHDVARDGSFAFPLPAA